MGPLQTRGDGREKQERESMRWKCRGKGLLGEYMGKKGMTQEGRQTKPASTQEA